MGITRAHHPTGAEASWGGVLKTALKRARARPGSALARLLVPRRGGGAEVLRQFILFLDPFNAHLLRQPLRRARDALLHRREVQGIRFLRPGRLERRGGLPDLLVPVRQAEEARHRHRGPKKVRIERRATSGRTSAPLGVSWGYSRRRKNTRGLPKQIS